MHFHWRSLRRPVLTAAITAALLLVAAGAAGAAGSSTSPKLVAVKAGASTPDSVASATLETIQRWNRVGRTADAERAARARLTEAEETYGKESAEVAAILDELAVALRRGGKGAQPEALDVCERSLKIKEHAFGTKDPRYATGLYNLGLLYVQRRNYDRARPALEECLDIRREKLGSNHLDVAKSLQALASLLHDQGKYFEALSLTERAIAIEEAALGAANPERAQGLSNLALLRYSTGDFSGAISLFEEAIRLWERSPTPNPGVIANSCHTLGVVYEELGDYERAIPILERALRIREEQFGRNHVWVASTLSALGTAQQGRGDLSLAKASFNRAVRILEISSPQDSDLGFFRCKLGWVYLEEGDMERADEAFRHALREQEEALGPDHPDLWMTLRGLAMVARIRGDLESARGLYERTLELVRKSSGPNHPDLGQTLAEYASFRLAAGDTIGAIETALRASEVNREHLRLTARGVAERQALLYIGSRETGLDVAFAALAHLSPARSGDYIRRGWDALIRSRALVLDEVGQRARLVEGAGDLVDLAKRLEAARFRLANLLIREANHDPEGTRELVARSREEVERAERNLAARSATFRSNRDRAALGWEQVASGLPSGSALVSYAAYAFGGRRELIAFVIGPDHVPKAIALGSEDEIDRLIARWRTLAATPPRGGSSDRSLAETACRQAGRALRARIWDPLVGTLEGSKLILIVPDGPLHLISFVALPSSKNGGYLIDSPYAIHYLSAERDIVTASGAFLRGAGMLAVGGASFDGRPRNRDSSSTSVAYRGLPESRSREIRAALLGCDGFRTMRFQALPGTVAEVDAVTKLWGAPEDVTVLEGESAGERAVKELLPGKRVAHFATHGFFLDRPCGGSRRALVEPRGIGGLGPEESLISAPQRTNPFLLAGLAFAGANRRAKAGPDEEDGILTGEEIASLDLEGLDWVVLSACDTGLGDVRSGEGVLGLRRAFEIAGANTLIMSLWSVEDQAAREWMSHLYEGRFRRNLETAEAVRDADRAALKSLRARGGSTHPFYWAGFVAAGGWR